MSVRNYSLEDIANKTRLYLEGMDNMKNPNVVTVLTEEAQANVEKFGLDVMVPYADKKINPTLANAISTGEEIYNNEHPKANTSDNLTRTAEMQAIHGEGPTLALVKKEEHPLSLPRGGYINIFILLYGILNIGIIVAIALLR